MAEQFKLKQGEQLDVKSVDDSVVYKICKRNGQNALN